MAQLLQGLKFCKDGVDHQYLLSEVQAERKKKYKSYLCPRCKEELIIQGPQAAPEPTSSKLKAR